MAEIRAGQLYMDADPRCRMRPILKRVVCVDGDVARCENPESGRKSRIRLTRLGDPRQYTLIRDVNADA